MPCGENLIWVHMVFWAMAAVLTFIVARHNNFGLKDALLATVGIKKFDRSLLINILTALTLLLPLGLAVWIMQSCPT